MQPLRLSDARRLLAAAAVAAAVAVAALSPVSAAVPAVPRKASSANDRRARHPKKLASTSAGEGL